MQWEQLLGPAGLAVAAVIAVVVLWREHQKDDATKDATITTLATSVKEFPAALRDLTAVVVAAAERERTRPRNERSEDR